MQRELRPGSGWNRDAENCEPYANRASSSTTVGQGRPCSRVPGATEHGLNKRVLKLLYDFLHTRLEAAAIMFAIDRALGLDGDSDNAADLERRLRVDILEEAQRRANARGSEIKVALGLSASL